MSSIILALALLSIATFFLVILSAYSYLSVNEYKRRARTGDLSARKIYQVLLYGKQLNLVIWFIIGLLSAISLVILYNHLPVYLTVIAFAIYTSYVYGFIYQKKTKIGLSAAKIIAPYVSKFLEIAQPILRNIIPISEQSIAQQKIYEVDDLLNFLKEQQKSLHNRIDKHVINNAIDSILFKEKVVHTTMTGISKVFSVDQVDVIGPVLMEELHASGHSFFPVYKGKKTNIVGSLYLKDILDVKKGGLVKDYMHSSVYYVHEDSSLETVISAILKTNQNNFIVADKTKTIVGLITATDVFRQIMGAINPSELERYDNLDYVIEQFNKNN